MCDLPRGSGRCRAGPATPSPGPGCGGSWGPATGRRGLQLSPTDTARTRGAGGRPCSDEGCGPGAGPGRKPSMALRGLRRRAKPRRWASRRAAMSPLISCLSRGLHRPPYPSPVVGRTRPPAKMHVPSSLGPVTVSPRRAKGLAAVIRLGTLRGAKDPGSWWAGDNVIPGPL